MTDTFKFEFTETLTQIDDDHDGEEYQHIFLGVDLYINEKKINCFTDAVAFLFPANIIRDTYHPYDRKLSMSCKSKLTMAYSDFYPFTCSCGVAGCASIWDGIHVKDRKHTIEWRVPTDSGYKFLDKRFYSFRKEEYLSEVERLKDTIKSRPDRFMSDWESCAELAKRLGL